MCLTLPELCDKLKTVDEITLLEQFNLTSEDLVSRCIDIIEDNFEKFAKDFEEENND